MNLCKVGPLASGIGFFLFLSGAAHAQSGQMVNAMDGLCLQVNGPIAAGSRLQIATCTGTPNQLFTKTAANELRMNGNLCVDAYGGGSRRLK
jgi:Ricin-type beta-trefoil lectin domain.